MIWWGLWCAVLPSAWGDFLILGKGDKCPAGKFDKLGQWQKKEYHLCHPCQKGRYNQVAGQLCQPCPGEKYQPDTGKRFCWERGAGESGKLFSSCPVGNYNAVISTDQAAEKSKFCDTHIGTKCWRAMRCAAAMHAIHSFLIPCSRRGVLQHLRKRLLRVRGGAVQCGQGQVHSVPALPKWQVCSAARADTLSRMRAGVFSAETWSVRRMSLVRRRQVQPRISKHALLPLQRGSIYQRDQAERVHGIRHHGVLVWLD